MANLYLTESVLTDARAGESAWLTGPDARHAASVARVRVGETLLISDGAGTLVHGSVESARADAVAVRVEAVTFVARPRPRILLAQALAKGDRDELAVQAATELGVDGVIPWAAERSVVRWQGEKRERGRQRWGAVVREAAKQSERAWVPSVEPLASTADLVELAAAHRVLVLEPTAEVRLSDLRVGDAAGAGDIVLVVGPEGGLSAAELKSLAAEGAQSVRLGSTVLRTSTAGPAALAVLSVALRRW